MLSEDCQGANLLGHCMSWLPQAEGHAEFVRRLKLSPADREKASEILEWHGAKVRAAADSAHARRHVKGFLKPLRERRSDRAEVKDLIVEATDCGPPTFAGWLSADPSKDRLRDIRKSRRILHGLKSWPLAWLHLPGVVCYERAAGRIRQERGGRADGAFLRGVIRTDVLPTATANASDHYVLLLPGP